MTSRLILVCHAATEATRAAAFPVDEPIEPREAARCARLLPWLGASDLAWSGPERRCRDTAEQLRLAPAIEPALRDCDYGSWAGRTLRAVEAEDAAGLAAWITDPAATPHAGEALLAVMDRVASWLGALPAGRHVAVTHASLIRAALVTVLEVPPETFWRFDIAPLSYTDLRQAQGRWVVRTAGGVAVEPPVISG